MASNLRSFIAPIFIYFVTISVCNVEGRTGRILTGAVRTPVREAAVIPPVPLKDIQKVPSPVAVPAVGAQQENATIIATAESNQPPSFLLPPSAVIVNNRFSSKDFPKLFKPLDVPSLQNHRLSGNWSQEITNNSLNEVKITSVTKHTRPGVVDPVISSASTNNNNSKSKIRRKVNVEKFRECVFFRVCKKEECFHYGRFGQCKTKPN